MSPPRSRREQATPGGDESGGAASVAARDGAASVVLRGAVLAVVVVNAVLLALTELAWLSFRIGAVPVPFPILLAAVTTPLLVRVADTAWPGSRAALAPLGAWLVVVVVVGLWSPAGPGVMPPDWRALLFVAAGLFPAAWVAARPVRPTAA